MKTETPLKSAILSLFLLAAFAGSALAHTVSGSVTYEGANTGRIYVTLQSTFGGGTVYGVSIASPGSYTVRGVPDGSYTLQAYMDTVGIRERHPGDPTGSGGTVNVSGGNVTGANVTLADPTPAAPQPPASLFAAPGNGTAFLMWETQRDMNGVHLAESFRLYWSTNPSFLSSWPSVTPAGSITVLASERNNVYIPTGLTNATTYYYLMEGRTGAVVSGQTVTAAVTPAPPAGGHTVSGTITYSGISPAKMHAILFSDTGVYLTTIAFPTSPQVYAVPGVADGSYSLYPVFDLNGNGLIDPGDVVPDEALITRVTVSGSDETGVNATVAAVDGVATVTTTHMRRNNGCEEGYAVRLRAMNGAKQVVNAAVYSSGSNSVQIAGPIDLGPSQWGEFSYWGDAGRPAIGDRFDFDIQYADLSSATLIRTVSAVLDDFPTALAPLGVIATNPTPTFSWTPASVGYAHTHQLWIQTGMGGWESRDMDDAKTSAVYNEDGDASPATLSADEPYEWTIALRDAAGNEAQVQTAFSMGSGIAGLVTSTSGTGLGCVQINVTPAATTNGIAGAWTNPDGTYSIGGFPAGSYKVSFDGSVPGYANEWYNDKASWGTADSVNVTTGALTTGVSATLVQAGIIAGRVTDGASGIANIRVEARDASTGNQVNSVDTDGNGYYSVGGLADGSYKVFFSAYSSDYRSEWYNDAADQGSAQSILVTAGTTTTLADAVLAIGGKITGTVTGSSGPLAGARVSACLYNSGTGWCDWNYQEAVTNASGVYTLRGLAAGDHKVYFDGSGVGHTREWYDGAGGTVDQMAALTITISLGATTSNIDGSLAAAGAVSGRVTNGGGSGIASLWVEAQDPTTGQNQGGGQTDANGYYTINGLAAGNYKIKFNESGTGYISEWYDNSADFTGASLVSVTTGSTHANINAQLATGGSIAGRVTNGATGISGVQVNVCKWDGFSCNYGFSGATTDGGGNFTLASLPTGSYKIEFNAALLGYVNEWWQDSPDQGGATLVAVVSGATTTLPADAVLAQGGGISGTVTNSGATGIANMWVRAYNASTMIPVAQAQTNGSGNYTIGPLPSGGYKVCFDGTATYKSECYDNASYLVTASTVTVTAPVTTAGINAVLSTLYSLTVTTAGTGVGNVYSSNVGGISCGNGGTNCESLYADGTVVDLAVNPAFGSIFTSWSGDCSGAGACSVTMNSVRSVVATFTTATYSVSAVANAGGTLDGTTPSPVTVNHGSTVSFKFNANTGYHIASVDDSCTVGQDHTNTSNLENTYTYTTPAVTANCTVTANFASNIYTVTPVTSGTGSISPDTPQNVSHNGTTNFTVTPGANHHVVSVTGCGGTWTGSNPYTTGAITADCGVTATFAIDTFLLTVTKNGTGTGVVTANTGSLNWAGNTGTATYDHNTVVTLTAAADASSTFTGWSGAGCAGTGTCQVTMDAARSVTATFTIKTYTVTASAPGGNGTITPPSAVVSHGSTTTFTVSPNGGFAATMSGTCGGTLVGMTFTTNAVTGDCTVIATFTLIDTTPDAFSFTAQTGVTRSAVATSNSITVAGINTGASISVDLGEYSVNNGPWTATTGTVNDGETVRVRQTASVAFSTATIQTLTIGGVAGAFSVTTEAADTTPDAFSFMDQTNVSLSTVVTSNSITVTGINTGSAISVTGGEYSVNGGGWISTPGTVNNNDSVQVRHTSSASNATAVNTVLTIGGVSDTFTSTTVPDTTPDAFSFADQTNVALSTVVTSNSITVTGIGAAAAISVSAGGEYSVNGGGWVSTPGTVNNNDTVRVHQLSSSGFSTTTDVTLTIGGVSDTFSVTTLAADTTPDAFSFTDQTGVALSAVVTSNSVTVTGINTATAISVTGGEYSVNGGGWVSTPGTVNNNDTVQVRHTSSASNATAVNTTLNIGSGSDTFTSTTLHDTTPDAFSFTDQTNVSLSTVVTSNSITVTGITTGVAISITGGEYSVNGGGWVSTPGTVNNNDTVQVRHTSSASNATAVNTVLTIGGVSDTFTSTTVPDTTPDAFSFADQTNVALSTVVTSNSITVTGIGAAAAISIAGGEYSVNGGGWVSTPGTVNNNDTVRVRQTSSASFSTTTDAVLTIGGVSDTFSATTLAADTTPDTFAFVDQTNVALSTVVTSNSITATGINTGAAISITGGEYSVNGGGWVSTPGTVNNNDTVQVRHTSSGSNATAVNTTLTIGGVSDTFTSTTLHDTTPNAFTFIDQSNVSLSTVVTSNSITVLGITTSVAISVSGGEYEVNGSAVWTTATGSVVNGDTVKVRHTSSASNATTVNTTLTVGGVSDIFTSTTVPDTTPNAFTFVDQTNVPLSTVVTSNTITVAGIGAAATISITGGEYRVNGGGWMTTAGTVNSSDGVQVRQTSSAGYSTTTDAVLTIGGVSDTFSVTTVAKPDGDLDGTPGVSAADALLALRMAHGLIAVDLTHADVAPIVGGTRQPNGLVDHGDVIVILRKAVNDPGLASW